MGRETGGGLSGGKRDVVTAFFTEEKMKKAEKASKAALRKDLDDTYCETLRVRRCELRGRHLKAS